MDKLNNIIIPQAGTSANSPQGQSSGLSKEDLLAFLTQLVNSAGKAEKGGDLAAKLSQLLKDKKIESAEALKLLQQLPPGQNDALIKQLSGMLKTAPEVKPALTSDLSNSLSAQLQDTMQAADPEKIFDQLRDQFTQLTDMSPEALSEFRQDAIHLMESMGFGAADIESMLVRLAMDLKGMMSDEQMTLLMMPFRPDAPAGMEMAAKAQPASAHASATPITPQELAEQQLNAAAQNPQTQKPATRPATAPEKAQPAPQQQAPQQQQAQPQPQPDTQAAKPAPQTPSNLALLNGFAGDNSGFSGGGFGGQSFAQGGYASMGGLQMTSGETAGNFINHMSAANASSSSVTTQMIALQIHRNAQAQVDTFRMQLHPAEMGRLEVRLKFGRDGSLKAHLIADKQDTLTLLQKDQVQLQKVLQDAGVDIDGGGLSFDLRQQQHEQDTSQSYNDRGAGTGFDDEDAMQPAALQAKIALETTGFVRPGGVNITV